MLQVTFWNLVAMVIAQNAGVTWKLCHKDVLSKSESFSLIA